MDLLCLKLTSIQNLHSLVFAFGKDRPSLVLAEFEITENTTGYTAIRIHFPRA